MKQTRVFLGLRRYYKKFIACYVQIVAPLTDLLQKNAFGWTVEAQQSFQQLKEALISTPVLIYPNFEDTFVVETDAGDVGIGTVLTQ